MSRAAVRKVACWLALGCAALGTCACDSELVTLGRLANDPGSNPGTGGMTSLSFGEPRRLSELGSEDKDDNATLTFDLTHVYFTSTRGEGDGADVWHAERSSADEPFGAPSVFAPGSSPENDASPAISLDGNTFWVARRVEDSEQTDIWVTTSTDGVTWSELRSVTELNSPEKDIPRPPAGGNRVMPLGSQRGNTDYRTFLAMRPDDSSPFGAPVPLPELEDGKRVVDGFLTEDLLMLFYSSGDGEDEGDLWVARRSSPDAPFGTPEPLSELNTAEWDERDPWVAPDLSRIFFTSNRVDENHEIFEATITLR